MYQRSIFRIDYKTQKRTNPTLTFYRADVSDTTDSIEFMRNRNGSTAQVITDTISTDWVIKAQSTQGISYRSANTGMITDNAGSPSTLNTAQYYLRFHYVVDARLGIV